MNIEKFFIFAADIVLRARCIACVSAVNLELSFGSDADSVLFQVVATLPLLFRVWSRLYICVSIICIYSENFL